LLVDVANTLNPYGAHYLEKFYANVGNNFFKILVRFYFCFVKLSVSAKILLELNERPNNVEIFVHGLSHQLGKDLGQGPPD
jgi:hypothetical protein